MIIKMVSRSYDSNYRNFLIILSIISFVINLISTKNFGPGISPDSVQYLASANSIVNNFDLITYDGTKLVVFPPLYPVFLAMIDFVFGFGPLFSARIVNAFLFGLIVFLSGYLFRRYLSAAVALAKIGTVSTLVSVPIIQVSMMVWSENLFICLILINIIFSDSYSKNPNTISLLLLSFSVALATLTRYVGLILIFTGLLNILISLKSDSKIKYRHIVVFLIVSVLPLIVWLIRNYIFSNTFFGPRYISNYSLFQNLIFTMGTIALWYLPLRIFDWSLPWKIFEYQNLLFISILVITVISVITILRLKMYFLEIKTYIKDISNILLFIITYLISLIILATVTNTDHINYRLLSPIYVPVTIIFLLIVSEIIKRVKKKQFVNFSIKYLLVVYLAIWLIYSTYGTIKFINISINEGFGFAGKTWRNNKTIRYLLHNKLKECDNLIYSNSPQAIYIWTNHYAKMLPEKKAYGSFSVINDISSLINIFPEKDTACIVWFDEIKYNFIFTIDELKSIYNISQLISFEDGAIYIVSKKY